MPPSPGVEGYTLDGQYNPLRNDIEYTLVVKVRPETVIALRDLSYQQLNLRSRDIALGARPLQTREFDHRQKRIKDNSKYLDTIRAMLTVGVVKEMWDVLLDATLDAYQFDPTYIGKYIKEHQTSSTGTGYKWGELSDLAVDDWKLIYDESKAWMEQLSVARYDQKYLQLPYLLGMRARSNLIDKIALTDEMLLQGTLNRSRIVMYRAALSMPGVFMPDKTSWYRTILGACERAVHASHKIHYPMIEGGQVYQVVSDLLNKGMEHYAYDGGSWESVVGEVFKGPMNPMLTQLGDLSALPSGIYATSALGTMLSLVVANKMMSSDDEAVLLGDDINIFSKQDRTGLDLGDLIAYQADDSDIRFVLGVAYKWDTNAPRIVGFKCTTDRADKSIHLSIDESGIIHEQVKGKADQRTVALWHGLYHGQFGYQTLLEALKRTVPAEFRGGSEIIHKMAEEGYKDVSLEEAEGWNATN
jgi:hypothetical protein